MIMKLKQSFVIVLLVFLLNLAKGKKNNSVVSYAINAIIEKRFVNLQTYSGTIDINFIGNNNLEFLTLMDKLLKIKSANTKVTVYQSELNEDFDNEEKLELGYSGIVIFDSVKSFVESASSLLWVNDERYRNHHLVYVPGLTTSAIIKTFDDGFEIDHVNFLMHETDNSIELVTGYMFTPQACKQLQLKTINRFDLPTLEWDTSIFYPNKYESFYGCELIVACNEGLELDVPFYNLLQISFKEQLHAKLTCDATNVVPSSCEMCDLITQGKSILHDHHEDCIVSDPVIYKSLRIIIAPGEPYTDFERMFMMFDFGLWIAISVTFIIAFTATLVLNFVSRKIRNFIVGRYVRNPTMNLLSTFLTGSQTRTPGRNFARFILILFIFWSLIIRTCHQSMLYELMQADLRRPTIKTIEELFQSKLTYYEVNNSIMLDEYFEEQMKKPSTRFVK